MMQARELDAQAKEILESLKVLGELLDKPVARDALDLNKNATTSDMYEILRRLRQSLKQYLERGGDLFYVGLLGHFSAGKSSTINSLLGTWERKHERSTGLNPTDTTLTLITQEKNSTSLLGIIREGHVTIRHQPVDNSLLDSVVLVDTPGTGDPQLLQEIARDFLPIYDVILFLFSAASPLDQADLPLLSELHNRLRFIPIRFVITRGDELRSDASRPLTEQNIDPAKKASFLAEVVSRVNALLKPIVYTSDQFIIVDNKSGYNIAILKDLIESKCNSSNAQARISMHGNKLHYYLSGAKELRNCFAQFLETKLLELSKIVSAADRNIQRYNEIVRISNSNLTKAWLDQVALINSARGGDVARLKGTNEPPLEYSAFASVIRKHAEVTEDCSREARFIAGSISARLNSALLPTLQEHFRQAEAAVATAGLDKLAATSHGISSVQIDCELDGVDLVPRRILARKYTDLRAAQADALQDTVGDMRRAAKEIDDLLQGHSPFSEFETIITSAQESLTEDLNQFFQNVELYRGGVFSHQTKESIATLGIGSRLDELESEFTADDKSSFTATAMHDLFPRFTELTVAAATHISKLSAKLRPLLDSLRGLKIARPDDTYAEIQNAASDEQIAFQAEISRQLQVDSDRLCERVALALSSLLVNTKTDYDSAMRAAKGARRTRYFLIIATSSTLAVCAYAGYRYLSSTAPQSIFETIIWGLVSSVVGDAVGYLIARLRDSYPETTSRIHEKFGVNLRASVHKAIEEGLSSHKFEALNEVTISHHLREIYAHVLSVPADPWHILAMEHLREIKSLYSQLDGLRLSYIASVDEVHRQCAQYFTDASKNLEVLNRVAGKIKERAIEPSFGLLDQTRRQLEYVKKEIEGVEFA
jgi:predicted GTPase